jgi:hypothetical protein
MRITAVGAEPRRDDRRGAEPLGMTTVVTETLAERLARRAEAAFGGCALRGLRRMSGGHSGITYVAEL